MGSESICKLISSYSFNYGNEEINLQDGLEQIFKDNGIGYTREYTLGPKHRIDFMLENGVGLEVKIKEPVAAVQRQLWKYSESPEIWSIILVTTRFQHLAIPRGLMFGKSLIVVHVGVFG